jgi:hypothetical protein
MAKRAALLVLACVAGGWLPAAARAQLVFGIVQVGDVEVTVGQRHQPYTNIQHGYTEYLVSVRNTSQRIPHEVRLVLMREGSWYAPGPFIESIRRTVHVEPGAVVPVPLLQPNLPAAGNGLEVTVDGQADRGWVAVSVRSGPAIYADIHVSLLSSKGIGAARYETEWCEPKDGPQALDGQAGYAIRSAMFSQGGNYEVVSSASDVKDWSTRWLAYSSYDLVFLTADEVRAIAGTAVWSALVRYVECGGCLLVVGPWEPPAGWRPHTGTGVWVPALSGTKMVGLLSAPHGAGPLVALSARAAEGPDLGTYQAGFGQCLVYRGPKPELGWKPRHYEHIHQVCSQTAAALGPPRSATQANHAFPVAANVETPVRPLFLMMLLFAIAIGPVNLYLLARAKRRVWMLGTVPGIALVTCLAVFGTMLAVEGWHARTRTEGLTLLDESSGRASTIGWTAFYTPLTPRGGLHFSADTDLEPQLAGYSSRFGPRSVEWTDHEQHLTSGWVTARVPAHFRVRKSEAGRPEHLAVSRGPDGSRTVTNHLGTGLRRLWLADASGTVYTASDVVAGGTANLEPAGAAGGEGEVLRRLFVSDWTNLYDTLTESPQDYLRPGCYLAALEGSPFLEPGLDDAQNRVTNMVVYGILKEPADAD